MLAESRPGYGDLPAHLAAAAQTLAALSRTGGAISLAETIGQRSQRLYLLVDTARLGRDLSEKLRAAEEAIYEARDDLWVNWDERDIARALEWAGFTNVSVEAVETQADLRIQPAAIDRWFGETPTGERASYRRRLAETLTPDELVAVEALYRGQLTGQSVVWHSVTAFVAGRRQHDPQDGGH